LLFNLLKGSASSGVYVNCLHDIKFDHKS
jgi:hypothetical protein